MRIVLDAMGTDNAPVTELDGALLALESDPDLHVILTGDQDLLAPQVEDSGAGDRIRVVHAPERVMEPSPRFPQCAAARIRRSVSASTCSGPGP